MMRGLRDSEDNAFKKQMEVGRFIAATLIQPSLSKGHRGKGARKLFPFPWDDDYKASSDAAEAQASLKRIRQRDKKKTIKSAPLKITANGRLR